MKLIVFRHGQTDYNAQRRFQGHMDIALNTEGLDQAQRTAAVLWNLIARPEVLISSFWTSDLRRSVQTANQVQSYFTENGRPLPIAQKTTDLREYGCGRIEGFTADEYELKFPGALQAYLNWYDRDPLHAKQVNGESTFEVQARLQRLLAGLTPHNGTQLWSAHGGILQTLVHMLGMKTKRIGNGDILVLSHIDELWILERHYEIGTSIAASVIPL